MKTIKEIKKFNKVQSPEGEVFQMVEITINYFGKIITDRLDTRITDDGQFIIGGNGFFADGYKIA